MTYHAHCACGAVTLAAEGAPVLQFYCHCTRCRSMTGAPVNAIALWPRDKVTVTSGEERVLRWTRPGSGAERLGCRTCGGMLGADLPYAGLFDIFAGLVQGLTFAPTAHLNYENTVMRVADGLPKFKDMPERSGGSGEMIPE